MNLVYLSLGTNLGDRISNIELAYAMITQSTTTTTTAKQGLNSLRAMTLHMCDFYMDALQQQNGSSGFCPQAPHLLLHPHQSTYIM